MDTDEDNTNDAGDGISLDALSAERGDYIAVISWLRRIGVGVRLVVKPVRSRKVA